METTFLGNLSEPLKELYNKIVSTSWAPEDEIAQLFYTAAQVLYPSEVNRLVLLGKAMSMKSYTGIYKAFLRIPSIQFIIKRAASIWKTYHDKGEASVENITPNSADFVVRNFPEYPKYSRDVVVGHLIVLFELTGHQDVKITFTESDNHDLCWTMNW